MLEPGLIDDVATAIREVGAAEVLPRFRQLADGDISEKSPGDFVTIADQECERVLSERLRSIRDVTVVGEEATAANPALVDEIESAASVWVIDPIDGTSNFVAGKTDFAVMVSLVENGVAVAAWVWHPEPDAMYTAELAAGTKRNGVLIEEAQRSTDPGGILKLRYMDEPARTRLADFPAHVGVDMPALKCAGTEYIALINGKIDFLFYWRTLPWDHACCALLASEAGLRVARPDGSDYRPGDGRRGLLAAIPTLWDPVAAEIQAALK